jgi:hypothetical protein
MSAVFDFLQAIRCVQKLSQASMAGSERGYFACREEADGGCGIAVHGALGCAVQVSFEVPGFGSDVSTFSREKSERQSVGGGIASSEWDGSAENDEVGVSDGLPAREAWSWLSSSGDRNEWET